MSDVTLKAETGVAPPPAFADYCFKATFSAQNDKYLINNKYVERNGRGKEE